MTPKQREDMLREAMEEALRDLDRQPSPADARKRARSTLRGALRRYDRARGSVYDGQWESEDQ